MRSVWEYMDSLQRLSSNDQVGIYKASGTVSGGFEPKFQNNRKPILGNQ
jgi:hypothetical protein